MTRLEIAKELRRHALRGAARFGDLPSNEAYWEISLHGWPGSGDDIEPVLRRMFLLFVAESLS